MFGIKQIPSQTHEWCSIQMGTKHCVTRTHRIWLYLQTEEQVRYGQQAIMEKWIQNAIIRMWITLTWQWLIFFIRLSDSKHRLLRLYIK